MIWDSGPMHTPRTKFHQWPFTHSADGIGGEMFRGVECMRISYMLDRASERVRPGHSWPWAPTTDPVRAG